jgi:transcriptional regulator with XRE-family HTH domain
MPATRARALGERIREARKVRCDTMTLEAFGRRIAEELGRNRSFSNVTVSNWETGRQEPSWEALIAMACLTHLPLEYFAGVGTVQAYPYDVGQTPRASVLAPRLVHLATAVQRFEPELQWLILGQLEVLVESLGDERASRSS